jgi:hypothetical protein
VLAQHHQHRQVGAAARVVVAGAVFTVRHAEAVGETFPRVREVVASIEKVTHFDSPEDAAGGSHNCLIRLLLKATNVANQASRATNTKYFGITSRNGSFMVLAN